MGSKKTILILTAAGLLVLLYLFNMAYFSIKPDFFQVQSAADSPRGEVFADVLIKLIDQELKGPGGWLPNDIPPSPTWFLDNRPNFQRGVLEAVRYSSQVLRDNLSRQRTTDKIDADCDRAFTYFSNDPDKWIMPSAEGKYKAGAEALNGYVGRLKLGTARFYPRSDNLIQLLEKHVSLLGGVNTRLLNASRDPDIWGEEPGDPVPSRVSWLSIDDNFYYAQGVGFALYHLFKAIRIEFAQVLKDKNADVIVGEITASLQEAYFEPIVVTNGGKDGILANHSNNLRVFLDDARQKSNSLIRILDQG